MQNRSAKAMNDVGWNIWTGNYNRYLYQYDPDSTSQGYWRVGPKDQPYGRFARGFDTENGKNKMFFKIDDNLFSGKPLKAAFPVEVRIVWFDKGNATWSLLYDAVDDKEKHALLVKKKNTGKWKESTVLLKDACFAHRCEHKTDIILENIGNEDTLFHMIEVIKKCKKNG